MKINKIKEYIKKPSKVALWFVDKNFFWFLPDKAYIKLKYRLKMGEKLDLNNPKTYNEKLQWLKLYNRKDIFTKMVDKYDAKKYVANIIGEQYIIPTIGVYDNFDEIDFDKLPNQFVMKCTHDSGGLVICKDKSKLDIEKAKKKINHFLKRKYYYIHREWPYKNVKRRIIIEEYMEDNTYHELRDYKFFCFNGKVELMFVATNRQGKGDTYFDFFDKNYNHLDIINGHPMNPICPKKPKNFSKMVELAEKLSNNLPHLRVDFYEINGKVYFGELTFFHWSGLRHFEPEEWDYKLGDLLKLDNVKNER